MTEKQARKNLTLEVLIATCGPEGGKRVAAMVLPVIDRVKYLVSWQDPQDAPVPEALSSRKDVRVLPLPGRGLSRNRNHCLDNATGDLLMIADDDLRLYPEGLKAVIRTFEDNPTLEYGSFRYDSDYPKEYPAQECSLATLPKNFFQTSFEIILRRYSRATITVTKKSPQPKSRLSLFPNHDLLSSRPDHRHTFASRARRYQSQRRLHSRRIPSYSYTQNPDQHHPDCPCRTGILPPGILPHDIRRLESYIHSTCKIIS